LKACLNLEFLGFGHPAVEQTREVTGVLAHNVFVGLDDGTRAAVAGALALAVDVTVAGGDAELHLGPGRERNVNAFTGLVQRPTLTMG